MQENDEAKELWPGAGLWLDLENAEYASEEAMVKVDQRLEEIEFGIERRLEKQKAIREIEKKEELDRRYHAERAKKEKEDRLRLAALARQFSRMPSLAARTKDSL